MSKTLEQIALRVAKESKLNEFMWLDESIETFTDEVVAVTDFARRLVAALGAQEPVAWLNKKLPHMAVITKPDDGGGWFPVYAAPQLPTVYQCPRCATAMQVDPTAKPQLPQREGWQWVPKEPTDAMIAASPYAFSEDTITMYKAMLAAAPKPEDKP